MRIDKNINNKYVEGIFLGLILILAVLFGIKCISVSMSQSFSFDGAMNVQIAQNLIKKMGYATSYDGINKFDSRVQTGVTVLLPVAILFKIFGESFANGLFVNAIYLFLLLLAIIYYLKFCLKINNFFVFLSVLLFYGTPSIFNFGFGLYGEIPALFFFLLSLILFHKYGITSKLKFMLFSGVCIGLGYLTKTVLLITLPAFIAVTIYEIIFNIRLNKKCHLQKYALFFLGFIIPVFIFEIYKLISMGSASYLYWWNDQIGPILMQAGVKKGFTDTNGAINKFTTHLGLLSSYVHINSIVIVILLALLLIYFFVILINYIQKLLKNRVITDTENEGNSKSVFILLFVTISYFAWWLFINPTEKAWYRRIINGTILLEICIPIILYFSYVIINKLINKSVKINSFSLFTPLSCLFFLYFLGVSVLNLVNTQNYLISFTDSVAKTSSLQAGEFVSSLPKDAEIFGFGWWQAPIIAFTSGRNINDINHSLGMDISGSLQDKYLVVDDSAYFTAQNTYKAILTNYENLLVYKNNNIYIYKLLSKLSPPYLKFSEDEKGHASRKTIDFTGVTNKDDSIVRNVYLDENNSSGRWAQQESAYLLKYDNEDSLRIMILIPSFKQYTFSGNQIEIGIFINNKLIRVYRVVSAGLQEISIPLGNVDDKTIEVELSSNARVIAPDDDRELSFVIQSIGLLTH